MQYSITSNPVSPTDVGLREFTVGASTSLVWPFAGIDSTDTIARVMIVTASTTSLNLLLPPANQGELGYTTIIINIGTNSFGIQDNTGGPIDTITSGQVKVVVERSNSTTAGTWLSYTLGATTAAANAALLAGFGLKAIATTLNSDQPATSFSSSGTFSVSNRAQLNVWTGGVGAATFALTSTLTNGWWAAFRNAGTGVLTLTSTAPDLIDGAATEALNPGDSALVFSTGTALYTVGIGRTSTVTDTQLTKNVAGNTDVTLTSTEYTNNIINFTGVLTGSINIIFPTIVKNYFLRNNTTGAFTLTAKTAAGTGIVITQGGAGIVTCDGTNIVSANTLSGSGTVTSIIAGTGLNGGTITSTGTIALANTAVTPGTYGDGTHYSTFTVDAQGRITSASQSSIASSAPFSDVSSLVQNASDGTKQIIFSAAGVSSGNVRTLTAPNTSDTLVVLAFAQTLTNKTISGASNTISGITETMLSTSDITTLNVSTSKHGFAPKSPNDATKYLDGTGAYSVPGTTASNVYQASPSNPTGTSNTTGVMMGLAGALTPAGSGKVMMVVSGNFSPGSNTTGAKIQIRYGTGSAPANAAALVGTAVGNQAILSESFASGFLLPFTCNAIVSGLTLSTAIWIDVSLAAITTGTASLQNISISVFEI